MRQCEGLCEGIAEPGQVGFKMHVGVSLALLLCVWANPLDSPTVDACECFDSLADGQVLATALSSI